MINPIRSPWAIQLIFSDDIPMTNPIRTLLDITNRSCKEVNVISKIMMPPDIQISPAMRPHNDAIAILFEFILSPVMYRIYLYVLYITLIDWSII